MALGPGSIAFVGFNADGNDNVAFVALEDLPPGTVIFFQDNEWTGSAFNTGESAWSWTATGTVAAGTVVRIDSIGSALATDITTNIGSVTFANSTNRGLSSGDEIVYAFLGSNETTPTAFLTAVGSLSLTSGAGVTLTGTGLTAGNNALSLGVATGADIAAYNGARIGQASFAAYAAVLNTAGNWVFQDASGDQSIDTINPDVPFSTTAFTTSSGETQSVAIAAGSLAVSLAEGNAGTTAFTFTVERTGGTTGDVAFSALVTSAQAVSADFAGAPSLPITVNGTITAGNTSTTITVNVAGDIAFESNESFTVTLQTPTNTAGSVTVGLGAQTVATGTITNDDAAPPSVTTILAEAPSLAGASATPMASNALGLVRLGAFTPSTGNGEVVTFDPASGKMFILNATGNRIDIVGINADGTLATPTSIDLTARTDFGMGGANSVAVKGGTVAVAFASATAGAPGHVALFTTAGSFITQLDVGAGPDHVTFTPDGLKLLVANEAEPVSAGNNPAGSISIISLATGAATASVTQTIGFASLNGTEASLRAAGIAVLAGQTASADIEPEYIAVSPDGTRAYVTLQEVNAVAVIDLTDSAATQPLSLLPLGGVDRALAGNQFDASDQDGGINLINAAVTGLLQPDSLASFAVGGITYFITANEGDARVTFSDSLRLSNAGYVLDPTAFPNAAALKASAALGRLNVLTNRGDTDNDGDFDQIYTLGGRGISIFQQNVNGTITKVRETGGEFERIIAALPNAATIFNQNQASATFDARSDDKGPEPEGVTTGVINGRTYAFAALERVGGVMVYDVTDPANATFVSYMPAASNDHGPEVVSFVAAADSPTGTALLLSANEVSGTTTVYAALAAAAPQQVRFATGSLTVAGAEGNAGSSTLSFTVERTGGTLGAVDFTVQLAAGAAAAGDFTGAAALPRSISGTIAAGAATATVSVDVAGDTTVEANETFTVTLTAASNQAGGITTQLATTQIAATGTISNDDAPASIGAIQGEGHTSLLVGQTVTIAGVVTAVDTNGSRGFFMQDGGDGNANTSDGIFVFLPSGTLPTVGRQVSVTGIVGEFTPSGAAPGAFSGTQLSGTTAITDLGAGTATATLLGGAGNLAPPTADLAAAGLFYERLEGMLVTVKAPVAVGPTSSFGEIFTVVDNDNDPTNGLNATGLTARGNILVTGGSSVFGGTNTAGGDFNPERIQIDDDSGVLTGFTTPKVDTGARLSDVTGVLRYDFGNYEVIATQAFTVATPSTLVKETSTLTGTANKLLVAAYNAENLDPGDGAPRFATIATEIISRLNAPDIITLQEIQDNDGATNTAVTSASTTLQTLVDAIATAGGPAYAFLDNSFIGDDTNGGQPGGNIRTAYLYRTDRVSFVSGSLRTVAADGSAVTGSNTDQQTNPDNPFYDSRPPLVADFRFNGNTVTVINNHFTSKGGSAPLLGSDQPPLNNGEVTRAAQAQALNNFVDSLLAINSQAKIIVAGDLNEFPFEEPMKVLQGIASISGYDAPGTNTSAATATYTAGGTQVLTDLHAALPANEQFDYIFEGNSQTLDHIMVSNALTAGAEFDVVRINADFSTQTSDHEPLLAAFTLPPTYTLQILHFYGESGTLGTQTAPILGALADKFRSETANTLMLAEGDNWIPGPWLVGGADPSLSAVPGIGTTALARPDVAIMNALGVNASALGNHEFDLGSPVVQAAITASGSGAAAWVGAQFPFITANLNFAADSSLRGLADASLGGTATNAFAGKEASTIKGKIAPSAVVTINGEKIGIVGATTYDLLTKTSPNGTVPKDDANPSTSDLQEVAAYVQSAVDALRLAGVNKIVMVDQLDTIERNKLLAPLVSGIDVMVAGGGHERLGDANDAAVAFNGHDANFVDTYPLLATGSDGRPVLIVTTDTEYTYLGRLQVSFDADGVIDTASLNSAINGAYAANEATLRTVYGSSASASSIVASSVTGTKVAAITGAIDAVVTAKDAAKYGFSAVYLEGDRVFARAQETNLGSLTADANAAAALKALGASVKVAVSLKNGGGIRASIGSIDEDGGKIANAIAPGAAGNVSQLDVENALRFDNKLMVFDTTPQGLLNILNYAAGLTPGNGGFPQLGGLRFSYDPTQPAGSKVRNVALYDLDGRYVATVVRNGVVVPSAPASIQVVSLNFTTNGGDGYPIKANGSNFRYLLADGTLSAPVSPTLDFTATANIPANTVGEQVLFETYMTEKHGTVGTAYATADTPASADLRIENLSLRADAVLDGAKPLLSAGDVDQDSAVLLAKVVHTGSVRFEVSTRADFSTTLVNQTVSVTGTLTPAKLDLADGTLAAGTRYHWRATDANGIADTASFVTPGAIGSRTGLRFGVSGDWRGELAPYPALANADTAGLDVFVKLGDTIYADYASPALNQAQAVTLNDYLIKQLEGYAGRAGMNTLNDLQKTTAIIAQIDDHEVINDFAGGAPVTLAQEVIYGAAAGTLVNDTPLYDNGMAAFQAYNAIEARTYAASSDARTSGEIDLYRVQAYGSDGVLFSLDARSFRDAELATWNGTNGDAVRFVTEAFTPGRTMLGQAQLARLKTDLLHADAQGVRWKFVSLPEPIQNYGPAAASDRYEGYAAERTELLKFIDDNDIENVVFVAADVHGTTVNNLTYQIPGGSGLGAQIALPVFEVTTGSVAFDAPFGPAVVGLASSLGLIGPTDVATYNALPNAGKELFFQQVLNTQLDGFGYDHVGLSDNLAQARGLLDSKLTTGTWTATTSFGWTEFNVDGKTGDLTVTTWGIPAYTAANATSASVLASTPTIQSAFTVAASSAIEFSMTSATGAALASFDYTNTAITGSQNSASLTDTTGADLARFRQAGGDVAITGANFATGTPLTGAVATLDWTTAGSVNLKNDGGGSGAKTLSVTDFTGSSLTLTGWAAVDVALSEGTPQSVTVIGGTGGSISTGAGDDTIAVQGTGFTLAAGGGKNAITGSAGFDTAVIKANRTDAAVVQQTDGGWMVITTAGTTMLHGVEAVRFNDGLVHLSTTAPSTTTTPFLVGTQPNVRFVSLLTAGDQVGLKPDGKTPWLFAGIPDGLGAMNNGNGTATILVNHEFGATAGVVRAHGGTGAFVDKLTVDLGTLKVTAASDLAQQVYLWDTTANAGAGGYALTSAVNFARLCSADLPGVSALYDLATGTGTTDRLYFTGEETGAEGRAFAFVVTGADAGKAYELPRLGNTSFENILLAPKAGAKTVAIGIDDNAPGQVYVYVGAKQATGNAIERAGLTKGDLYGIKADFRTETSTGQALTGAFTLAALGNVEQQTGATLEASSDTAGVTEWLRPEDGAWDTINPNRFYFVTTNNFTSPSRLWALDFTDLSNPALGGTFTALLDGTEGQRMLDNITVDATGKLQLQEDAGNVGRSSRIWQYDPATDSLTELARHDPARFGSETTPATAPFSQDEESSGIVDVTALFGNATTRAYLLDTQAHYTTGIAPEIIENGQLQLMFVDRPENGDYGHDVIRGSAADERLAGFAGDDVLTGGLGNDRLNGGEGSDTASFSGERGDYRIATRGNTIVVDGPDGRDTLVDIEMLRFGTGVATAITALPSVQELVSFNRNGTADFGLPDLYTGPVSGIAYQFLGGSTGEAVLGTSSRDFVNGLEGDDAIDGAGGDDILDGGIGSSFLTGGAGIDIFFIDGRGVTGGITDRLIWTTITDWQAGEQATIWGWTPGSSTITWAASDGTPGYLGATASIDFNGDATIDAKVTWTGQTQAGLPTPTAGAGFLWFH